MISWMDNDANLFHFFSFLDIKRPVLAVCLRLVVVSLLKVNGSLCALPNLPADIRAFIAAVASR